MLSIFKKIQQRVQYILQVETVAPKQAWILEITSLLELLLPHALPRDLDLSINIASETSAIKVPLWQVFLLDPDFFKSLPPQAITALCKYHRALLEHEIDNNGRAAHVARKILNDHTVSSIRLFSRPGILQRRPSAATPEPTRKQARRK
jgi:hypothetical protein